MASLELRDIWKAFGATQALAGAAIVVKPGEVHALVGANGAGKSTLSRIMSGQARPDRGTITLDDKTIRFGSSRDAILHGICMVTQETSLAPDLSVLENIMLPHLALPGRLRWRVLRAQGEALSGQAIIPDFSVRENLLLAHLGARAGIGLGYASRTTAIRDLLAVLDLPERPAQPDCLEQDQLVWNRFAMPNF